MFKPIYKPCLSKLHLKKQYWSGLWDYLHELRPQTREHETCLLSLFEWLLHARPCAIVVLGVVGWASGCGRRFPFVKHLGGLRALTVTYLPRPPSSAWCLWVSSGPFWTSAVRMSCCSWFSGSCRGRAEGRLILSLQGCRCLVHCWGNGLHGGCLCMSSWNLA